MCWYHSWLFLTHSPSTDPPVATNGGIVALPAVENATNVSVFCAVTFQGTIAGTNWRLGTDSMSH